MVKIMISLRRLVMLKLAFSRLCEAPSENVGLKLRLRNSVKHWGFPKMNLMALNYSTSSKNNSNALNKDKRAQEELDELEEDLSDEEERDELSDENEDDDDEDEDDEELEESNTEKIFNEIAKGDPEKLNKLKLLEFEVVLMKEMGTKLPNVLKKRHWEELLNIPSTLKKTMYLEFLHSHDLKELNKKEAQKIKRQQAYKKISDAGFHYYGLSGHTMFHRIYDSTLKKILYHRQCESKLKILFDCSYQDYMTPRGIKNCAKQVAMCLSEAQLHRISCDLRLCNLNKDDLFGKNFPLYYDFKNNPLFDDSHKSYLDLYPKEKLIYLSPHANQDLMNISHDYVYIIGAYVDKGYGVKASLAKAKENNLKAVRLPIDFYLAWKEGSKALTLPVVVNIMLDMIYYNDWYRAFKHIPKRNHYGGVSKKELIHSNRVN